MKNINKFLLIVLITTTVSACIRQYNPDERYFKVEREGNVVTITKYVGSKETVKIPSKIRGLPVTGIGDDAFSNYIYRSEIIIPDSVTSIGDRAFLGCINIISVTIPDSVTSIGELAFAGCLRLNRITIPDGVTRIGKSTFESCLWLNEVTIPDSVTSIGDAAFFDCKNLASITIPSSVTSIGERAFAGAGLNSIMVEDENPNYSSVDGILYNKEKTEFILIPPGVNGDVDIPYGINEIEDRAFAKRGRLTSINIPDSVTNIGDDAFEYCIRLVSINIPNSVYKIGEGSFGGCASLTSITIPASVTSIGRYTFYNCTSLTSVTFAKRSNITDTNFGGYAFPEGGRFVNGNNLKDAYARGREGTYTREEGGEEWTKQ